MDNWNIRMKVADRFCGKCGARFFADAPQEFCSACLLESGLFDEEGQDATHSESTVNSRRMPRDGGTARSGQRLADSGRAGVEVALRFAGAVAALTDADVPRRPLDLARLVEVLLGDRELLELAGTDQHP